MNRIKNLFESKDNCKKSKFIGYLVCGDPDISTTKKILKIMVESGVDLIELGVPFTDPIADGPIIQKASERALKNNTSLLKVLEVVKDFRKYNKVTPIVLMGYVNPVNKMGSKKFAISAKKSGVDGVLLVDLPPEESQSLNKDFLNYGLDQIFLASPTTDKVRLKSIIKSSTGYLYYVSIKGITGASLNKTISIKNNVSRIRHINKQELPIAVGFGIKNPKMAKDIGKFADAIVIGSSIVELIEKNTHQKVIMYKKIRKYLTDINNGLESI